MTNVRYVSKENSAIFFETPSNFESAGFTSKPLDKETGLYNFPQRYYDSRNVKWLTLDPVGPMLMTKKAGAVTSLNWYNYCSNNPVMYSDPSGLVDNLDGTKATNLNNSDTVNLFHSKSGNIISSSDGTRKIGNADGMTDDQVADATKRWEDANVGLNCTLTWYRDNQNQSANSKTGGSGPNLDGRIGFFEALGESDGPCFERTLQAIIETYAGINFTKKELIAMDKALRTPDKNGLIAVGHPTLGKYFVNRRDLVLKLAIDTMAEKTDRFTGVTVIVSENNLLGAYGTMLMVNGYHYIEGDAQGNFLWDSYGSDTRKKDIFGNYQQITHLFFRFEKEF